MGQFGDSPRGLSGSFLQLGISIYSFVKGGNWLDFIFTFHCRLRIKLKPSVVLGAGLCRGVGEAIMASVSRYQTEKLMLGVPKPEFFLHSSQVSKITL